MYLTSVNTQLIFFLYISYLNPLDTRRRFNVYKTSIRRRCMCLLGKRHKDKKRWNILKKMNSLTKGDGVPLLNFEGGPGVPLLNFEGGPGNPLLNFRGVPGPIFKLWRSNYYSVLKIFIFLVFFDEITNFKIFEVIMDIITR